MLDRIIEPSLMDDLHLPPIKIINPDNEELIKKQALMFLKSGLENLKCHFSPYEFVNEVIVSKMLKRSLKNFDTAFIVNTESSNDNDTVEGRTDLKIELSKWKKYFVFECKKLDGGNVHSEKYIKKGLVRFCDGKYCTDFDGKSVIHERTPNFGGMIGYIVKGDISIIVNNIKEKVQDNVFNVNSVKFGQLSDDSIGLLFENVPYFEYSFKSKHKRVIVTPNAIINNLDDILIYHVFFDLT